MFQSPRLPVILTVTVAMFTIVAFVVITAANGIYAKLRAAKT